MSFAFFYIPCGWLVLAVLYGLIMEKGLKAVCLSALVCLPLLFSTAVGQTFMARLRAMAIILPACIVFTMAGTGAGMFIRAMARKIQKK